MKHLVATFAVAATFLPGAAWSACGGKNLLAEWRKEDPGAVSAIEAAAAGVPNSEGRFWRVEKAGTAPSHIFGTHHASGAVGSVPDRVWATLKTAGTAVFELSSKDRREFQKRAGTDPNFVLDPRPTPYADLMSPSDLAAVKQLYRSRGLSVDAVQRLKPWMQIAMITFPPCQIAEMAAGKRGIDTIMAERVAARGLTDHGLETPEEAVAAIDAMDRKILAKMLVSTALYRDIEEDVYRTTLDLYGAGKIQLVLEFSMAISKRRMPGAELADVRTWLVGEVIVRRNRAWMPALKAHLDRGNAFVGVGALHLPGKGGLIELLRADGYQVTRIR